ncbi:eCIS core domain-containing protein [Granulicella arctica]|uniref:eCIS core domain-containing protein n=1 Tax=Granulicella arctica TaxID=940613 RepID=UPI0021E00E78|nr:DUF4157 domain-containing protein [Granulicella arctica]
MSGRSLIPEPARAAPERKPVAPALGRSAVMELERDSEELALPVYPELHLAGLEIRDGSVRVFDEDAAREMATRHLLQELAPILGLDLSRLEVHVDSDAERRTNARGATGLAENGSVYLHPQRFDPSSRTGRSLLAHETVHTAQRQIVPHTIQDTGRAHVAAEHEAAHLARAFAERSPIQRPLSSLPQEVAARAEDAPPTPALSSSVPKSRAREIAEIHRLLSGLWISDGDVFKVMRVLDTMPFAVAKEVVFELGHDDRYHLANNINKPHLGPHTTSVIATYEALTQDELRKAMDLDVFGEGDWGDMTRPVTQAAREVIGQLDPGQIQDLLRSDNRLKIKSLTSAAQLLPEDPEERKASDEKILKKEAELAASRKAVEALSTDPDANALLEKVRKALAPPLPEEGTSLSQQALAALKLLEPYRGTVLEYVAEKLDGEGLLDTLIQDLPDSSFAGPEDRSEVLLGLVRGRLASKNIQMLVDLLSYGAFDWAIRDYEAKFAYRVLAAMSLGDQYRFRQLEGGKYFFRLVHHLPRSYQEIEVHKASPEALQKIKGQFKPDARGAVDEEEGLYDAGRLYAQKRAEQGGVIQGYIEKFQAAHDAGWKKADAEARFQELAAVGAAGFGDKKVFRAKDQLLMETVVHDLDSRGFIEELFKALGDDFLFSEDNRSATVRIMMGRDPVRAAAHARDLVSLGLLDWAVTAREAFLAYLIVKALPEDQRSELIKNDGWAWSRIQSEMTEEMRQSRDLNLYVGDAEGKDRASVLGQLAEKGTWTEANAARLDGLLRMAIAMSEHKYAFERSQEFKAYADGKPALNALVKKYKLAESAAQKWKADVLKGTKWYEEGPLQTIRTIWKGLLFLFRNDVLLIRRTVGGNRLDLNQAQDVKGGSLNGVQLADPKTVEEAGENVAVDANKLTLHVDIGAHALTAYLPELLIDSVNFQSPGGNVEAGSVRLKNLQIYAIYDSEDMEQPTTAQINVGSFEIVDLLLAMREKMVSVSRLVLKKFHLGAGAKDTTTRNKETAPRSGWYFPIPFLMTIGTAVYYLFKFKGWGPDTPAQEVNHGMEQIRALDVTFDSLDVQGLTTSGGQTIGKLRVADFALRIGMNKTTALRAKIGSLDNQIRSKEAEKDDKAVAALKAQQAKANVELKGLEKDEKRVHEIQYRILHDKLSEAESKQLQGELDALKFETEGAQYLNIDSIDASGIDGGVTIKSPLHLEGLHGEGKANDLAAGAGLGLVTDAKLIEQITQGKGAEPTPLAKRGGDFRLNIDKLHASGVSVGGGQIYSSSDIAAKLKELERVKTKPEFATIYAELLELEKKAQRYEQYVEIGVSSLDDKQLEDFRGLRTVLARDASITFGSIDLLRAHLYVGFGTGRVGLGVDEATLKNITMPEKGLSIDEVKGTDIRADATAANGLSGWVDWQKNLQGGGLHAGQIEISGARDRSTGVLFKKATLKGAGVDVHDRGNLVTAGFTSLTVESLRLGPQLQLMQRRLAGLELEHNLTAAKRRDRDQLRKDLPALQSLADKRTLATARVDKAKTTEERKAADAKLKELDKLIAAGLARYGSARAELDEFGIQATGAGDVLGDVLAGNFNLDKTLKRGGVTLTGTGKDNQVLGHASVGYKSPGPEDSRLGKPTGVDVGPIKLNATVKEDGDNNLTVAVAQLDLNSISLSEILLSGTDKKTGGSKIWSNGQTSLNSLKFSGDLKFAPVDSAAGDYRLAHIEIRSFDIASIRLDAFGYEDTESKIDVRANSGTVNNVQAKGMTIDILKDKNADPIILGKASIGSISNADLSASLSGGLEMTHGLLNAKNLGIEFLKLGGKTISMDDLSLTAVNFRGPDGWAHLSLEHLSGAVTLDNDGYKLKNVRLQKLTVPSLDWKAGAMRLIADQPVELMGLHVDGHIEMKETPAAASKEAAKDGGKQKKESKLVGVHINSLGVDSIKAKHLTYQDDKIKVEVGPKPDDKTLQKALEHFQPFAIENFTIEGMDWTKETGISKGKIDVQKYGASVAYEDLSTHLKAGGGLAGRGMNATFTAPHTGTATIGTIDQLVGFAQNKDFSTKEAGIDIKSTFTFGENFIEMNDLTIKDVHFGKTTYGEGTNSQIQLGYGSIDTVKFTKAHVDYKPVVKEGKESIEVTDVHVDEIKFLDTYANNFSYSGKTEEMDGANKVTKTKNIKASFAEIEQLRFTDIHYDAAKAATTLGIHVEEDPAKSSYRAHGASAFRVYGMAGELVNKFSDGDTVAKFALQVDGGPISGDNIRLQTIKEDDDSGKTRTSLAGAFQLTRLGLENITGTYKDKKGNLTELRNKYGEQQASIEFEGMTPTFEADGTFRIPNIGAEAKDFHISRGPMSVSIPLVSIKDAALGMRGMGTEKGIRDFGLRLGKISVKNLGIWLAMHSHKATKDEVDAATADPLPRFFAEPFGSLDGDVILDLPVIPNEKVAITNGKLWFINAHPLNIGMDEKGLYLAARRNGVEKGRIHIHKMKPLPGLIPDFMESGGLDMQRLVEGEVNAPPDPYDPNAEEPEGNWKLNHASVKTGPEGLSLGKGRIGLSLSGKKEPGPDDFYLELENSQGSNILHIPESNLGEDLRINLPKFHAKQMIFPGGHSGKVDLDLFVDVQGLATLDTLITIGVPSGTIEDIEIGDMSALPAPATAGQATPAGKGAATP